MSETVTESEVAAYLGAVREALSDLEPADRDDLLEDLEAHLHEVLAEAGGASLESSLGSPAGYAAELRSSAGLESGPAGHVPMRRRIEKGLATSTVWREVRTVGQTPAARESAEFAASLRPAWWLVRGWLAVMVAVVLLRGNTYDNAIRRWVLFPSYHGHVVVGLVAVGVAVTLSVWVGKRSVASRGLRRAAIAGNVVLLVTTAFVLPRVDRVLFGPTYPLRGDSMSTADEPVEGLRLNGRQIVNIYPYDGQGHPLQGVRLYDDQGRPLQGLATETANGMPIVRRLPTDSAGATVRNEYPQQASVQTPPDVDPRAPLSAAASMAVWATPSSVASVVIPGLAIPAPAIVVPPLPGAAAGSTASPSPTATATPSPSARPTTTPTPTATRSTAKGTKTPSAASKPATRASLTPRSGAGRSASRTP